MVRVGEGTGTATIAQLEGSSGVLNIGAGFDDDSNPLAATAAGILDAVLVEFGSGEGALNFNHTGNPDGSDVVFAPTIASGAGSASLNQIAGTTVLAGDNAGFLGTTNVSGGKLVVANALGGTARVTGGHLIVGSDAAHDDAVIAGSVNVLSGGLLGGPGTVGTVRLSSGATISPGNSIGTLTVAGDITFDAGSIYQVEVDPEGDDSDLIHVTGTATLNGGSVAHIGADGTYKPFSTYTILTADSGIDGTFGSVTSDFAFLDPTLSYDADSVYLELVRNGTAFCMIGMTANQCATGTGAETTGLGNPLHDAIVGLSGDQATNAFDQLSGEMYASAKGILIDSSRFVRDAANDRIRSAYAAVGSDKATVMLPPSPLPPAVS